MAVFNKIYRINRMFLSDFMGFYPVNPVHLVYFA